MNLFVHLPKCGGTSLRDALGAGLGAHLYLDYGDWTVLQSELAVKRRQERWASLDLAALPRDPKRAMIFGHFLLQKWLAHFPQGRCLTILRDPLTRIPSNYYYLKRHIMDPDNELFAEMRRIHDWSALSLRDYIQWPATHNVMSRMLAGRELTDFFYVGLYETIDLSMEILRQTLEIDLPPLSQLNRNPKGPGYELDAATVRLIVEANEADWKLYLEARKIFEGCIRRRRSWPGAGG